MPSVCRNVKTEYEALKTLNQEFVSACEKAGDPRALSADQLRTLQIQKRELEHARDTLKNKIESEETRMLKRLWNETMETVIDPDYSPQRTIAEILQNNVFRTTVADGILELSEEGTKYTKPARDAVIWFESADDLGLLDDEQKMSLKKEVAKIKDMAWVIIKNDITTGLAVLGGSSAYDGIVGFSALRRLGVLEQYSDWMRVGLDTRSLEFRKGLGDELLNNARLGVVEGARAEKAIIGFAAALELGLINELAQDTFYSEILHEGLLKKFIEEIVKGLLRGSVSPTESHPIEALSALQRLIKLSRRRKSL